MPATKIVRPMSTRAWLDKLPQAYRDAFYENLADIRTHELWEWIIDLLPLRDAEDLMVNLTKHWEEDEIGTPYRKSMKR
jgi:hypothetical protein